MSAPQARLKLVALTGPFCPNAGDHFFFEASMAKHRERVAPLPVHLSAADPAPHHRQIAVQLRDAVLEGRLAAGVRLPSSRSLAAELGCSRNTVVAAYEQLSADGFVVTRHGAGSFVAEVHPRGAAPRADAAAGEGDGKSGGAVATAILSRRGTHLADLNPPREPMPVAFRPGLTDVSLFPFEQWRRLLAKPWGQTPERMTRHGDAMGYEPLRRALAEHLRAARGIRAEPETILITGGAQQALDMLARLLLDPGDLAWVEDPGYAGMQGAMVAAGATPVAVPVDAEGLCVEAGSRAAPNARLALVSPSHQYPTGVVMSLRRRLDLIAWAARANAWIVEDDYDSDFHYGEPPLAPLHTLDQSGRVIYVGTLSKAMFPGLRIGYMVVPPAVADSFARARRVLDDHPGLTVQPALAAFIETGGLAAHLRRMRRIYKARQDTLVEGARRYLAGALDVAPHATGLHLLARLGERLPPGVDDRALEARAAEAGVVTPALSRHALQSRDAAGLLLGYAAVPESKILVKVQYLAKALESL
jgi:GntR family transcriptional regulator/MocR family aminotransferase